MSSGGTKSTNRAARHLAFFLPALGLGGAEHNLLTVMRALAERGHRIDIVLIRAEGQLVADIPPHIRLVNLGARSKPGSVPRLARYLRAERPDAVLSAMASVNCMAVLARLRSGYAGRLVLSERSTLSMEVAHDWRRRLLPPMMRRLYPRADRVIAVSEGVAADLSRRIGLDRERIDVIHNPVIGPDLLRNRHLLPDDPWFAPDAPPVILSVGRLHPQKDHPTLIRAFAQVRAQRDCRLMILGEGAERVQLATLVGTLGLKEQVRMPGILRLPYGHMAGAAVFVLSSRWEGLPTVLIEAMACGAPVVSTDCDSGPREILMGGALGPLVPVGDIAALAAAILRQIEVSRPVSYPLDRFFESPAVDGYEAVLCEGL